MFATSHVTLYPPVMAAKMPATVDHISGGRFGLNVVAGFSPFDFAMFGIELDPNADRYGPIEEWLVNSQTRMDAGRALRSRRTPLSRHVATGPSGKAFSARNAEVNFGAFASIEAIPASVQENRRLAAEAGREVKIFGHGYVIVADTEVEARRAPRTPSRRTVPIRPPRLPGSTRRWAAPARRRASPSR